MSNQGARVRLALETGFLADALPLTLELATLAKDHLLAHLRGPGNWPFEDRVLGLLLPSMAPDIARYHHGTGPSMSEDWLPKALSALDGLLLARLWEWLEANAQGFTELACRSMD